MFFYCISLCIFFLASSKKDPFLQHTASHFGRALGTAVTPRLLALFHHLITQFINLLPNPTISAWTVPPWLYRAGLSKATLLWLRSYWSAPAVTSNAATLHCYYTSPWQTWRSQWCCQRATAQQSVSKGRQCGEQKETALLQGCTHSRAHSQLTAQTFTPLGKGSGNFRCSCPSGPPPQGYGTLALQPAAEQPPSSTEAGPSMGLLAK